MNVDYVEIDDKILIRNSGKITIRRINALPTWDSTDEGRLLIVEGEESKVYIGTDTEWKALNFISTDYDLEDEMDSVQVVNGKFNNLDIQPELNFYAHDHKNETNGYSSDLTFTRATEGRYWDAAGTMQYATAGELRHDHDPLTGEYLGVLIEESITNLCLRSEELDNGSWNKLGASVSGDCYEAPDGTTTADKVIESNDVVNTYHRIYQSITVAADTIHTVSVYAKAAERTQFAIYYQDASNASDNMRLVTDVTTLTQSTVSLGDTEIRDYGVQDCGNGWVRCWISGKFNTTDTDGQVRLNLMESGNYTYIGDGSSGMYFWGMQVEAGYTPTSYIPTEGASVTRNADVLGIPISNITFNTSEGSMYVETHRLWHDEDYHVVMDIRKDFNEFIEILTWTTDVLVFSVYNTTAQVTSALSSLSDGVTFSAASTWKEDDFAAVQDGGTIVTDTSGTVPTGITNIYIGSRGGSNFFMNGHIKHAAYFPRKLTDTQLKLITK